MSDLVYQNYNNKCKGWVNPSLSFGPEIISLTGYQSPAGSSTVISVIGTNFFSYSVVQFGTYTPTVYFINSTLISFYVPSTLNPGTYPVKVCNGSVCSNIVNYTIDMSSGNWLLNPGGNISNTNPNGVQVSWLSRGAPQTISNASSNPYTNFDNLNWIICDVTSSNINVTLPNTSSSIGREITFKTIVTGGGGGNSIINSSSIIKNIQNQITNVIIDSTQNFWATLVFDGSFWIIMQQGS